MQDGDQHFLTSEISDMLFIVQTIGIIEHTAYPAEFERWQFDLFYDIKNQITISLRLRQIRILSEALIATATNNT